MVLRTTFSLIFRIGESNLNIQLFTQAFSGGGCLSI
jgi:hypothetical protein